MRRLADGMVSSRYQYQRRVVTPSSGCGWRGWCEPGPGSHHPHSCDAAGSPRSMIVAVARSPTPVARPRLTRYSSIAIVAYRTSCSSVAHCRSAAWARWPLESLDRVRVGFEAIDQVVAAAAQPQVAEAPDGPCRADPGRRAPSQDAHL